MSGLYEFSKKKLPRWGITDVVRVETNTRRVFVALKNIIRSSFLKPNNMLSSFFFFKVFFRFVDSFCFCFSQFLV